MDVPEDFHTRVPECVACGEIAEAMVRVSKFVYPDKCLFACMEHADFICDVDDTITELCTEMTADVTYDRRADYDA